MEFGFSEQQAAVRESVEAIIAGSVTPDRVRAVEGSADRMDRALWSALAQADLLGLAVPDAYGGSGCGMVELALLLEAQGQAVAPVPLWASTVLGGLPIAAFGSDQLRDGALRGLAAGTTVLTAALTDVAGDLASGGPGRPAVRAEQSGAVPGGLRLTGTAFAVPYAHVADRVLVPAATAEGGVVVAAVDPSAAGVGVERACTTNREIHPHLHLDEVEVPPSDLLAGGEANRGAEMVEWMLERAWTGLCALQVGVAEAALSQTVNYLNQREQFGRPLATFQAAKLRAADAAIDIEAMRVTLWQAAWRLDHGLPAGPAVAIATWFAKEAGQRVVHATQHLHGGMGADIDYPIHRYFLWGKQIELLLGGPSAQLARLGRQVVDDLRSGQAVSA